MDVIVAPEIINYHTKPSVFLAGGITDCPLWQDEIIDLLSDYRGMVNNL